MFPSATSIVDSEAAKKPADSEDPAWLRNESFIPVAETTEHLTKESPVHDESIKKKTNDEAEEDDLQKRKKKHKKENKHEHKKKQKEKKKGSSKLKTEHSDSDKVLLPSGRDVAKVFIEEVSGLAPEHAFRVDRSLNLSILRFASLAPGHIARYARVRHHARQEPVLPSSLVIVGKAEDEEEAKKREKEKKKALRRQRYFYDSRKRRKLTARRVCVRSLESGIMDEEAFIPIVDAREEEMMSDEGEEKCDDKATLNAHLRENPNDVEAWIRLSQIEDNFVDGEQSAAAQFERTDAILERAVAANPASVPIAIHRLETAEEFWPTERLLRQWRQLVFTHPNRVDAWAQYLRFLRRQSAGAHATVSAISAAAGQCCATVRDVLAGRLCSHPAMPDAEERLMDVMEEHCRFLSESGHLERAVACLQLALEVNLCPDAPTEAEAESFWDSGQRRLGEPGARGIGAWRGEDSDAEEATLASQMQQAALEGEAAALSADSRAGRWAAMERLREAHHWLPAEDEEVEDAERVVLFEDVSRLALTRFSTPRLRQRLLRAALRVLDGERPATGDWRRAVARRWMAAGREAFKEDEEWGRELAEMELEIEISHISALPSSCRSKELKRVARTLLRPAAHRSHLPLYSRYAEAEWTLGSPAAARRIFTTACRLSPPPAAPTAAAAPILALLATHARLEWAEDESAAAAVLPPLAAAHLHRPPPNAAAYADAAFLLLLQHLLNAGLDAGESLLRQALAQLRSQPEYAVLAERGVRAMLHFAARRFLSPMRVLALLRECSAAMPDDPRLVRLRAETGRRVGAAEATLGRFSATGGWLAAIEVEAGRRAATGGENRVRGLFERAVASRDGRTSWDVWRRYLRFERTRREKARGVFYRAIQQCPFNKILLLDGVEILPECLQEVVDVIVERECRLRTPLEELELLEKQHCDKDEDAEVE